MIISNDEKQFILNMIAKGKRLDGRNLIDSRKLDFIFRKEWGGCVVHMGKTSVFAQVSAKIVKPKPSCPFEGVLDLNFVLSPMSSPYVNLSRSSDEFVELQRSLERCIRDSKCLDLESLCIVAGVMVWEIKLDIRAMNNNGNILECCSIAAISALAHFRRPDVTIVGTEVAIHSIDDREPVPLNLHNLPIAVTLAVFCNGSYIVMDPTEKEELVADGCYIIGINDHQEVCMIHRRGCFPVTEATFVKCLLLAVGRAQIVAQAVRTAVSNSYAILCSK